MTPGFSLRSPLSFLIGVVLLATRPIVHSLDQVEEVKLGPDVGKSTVELIEARGFVAETHNVTTADGYIRTLHRLPKSYDESQAGEEAAKDKPAVLIQHGLLDSSFSWVCNFRKAIAFVGHSEGKTQAFVAFSEDQTLAQSVSYFAALVPVAWLGNTKAEALKFLAKVYLDKIFEVFGQVEFLSQNKVLQEVIEASACTVNPELCETALALISGVSENWNMSRVSVYLSEMPAGTSVKNMGHYAQSIRKGTFSAYNYGCGCLRILGMKLCSKHICENKVKYGSFDPPAFPLSRMTYPRTGFFTGENDILATATDTNQLRAALPNTTIIHDEEISHLDFTWAVDANERDCTSLCWSNSVITPTSDSK
ncbi:Alpha/beta-hydrolase lipase region [Phytophthora infestans]|uniref:Alpha/beta-hydrolase lipase region n=1 Tax=Phytophthora infestans TaxID=4787 RepID=A0A833WW31_PHYIN|nr:Alpha/beta-hydrolase lipase region [Phytophthora infestans]KAF4135966.1 Alpha/beta-hydrolase lipase region [Phytophthora infestans]